MTLPSVLDRARAELLRLPALALVAISLAAAPVPAACAKPGTDVIDKALAAEDRDSRIAALEQALEQAETEADEARIALHLGEQLRLAGDARAARKAFKTPRRSDDADLVAAAELGTALAELAEGKDSMDVLRQVAEPPALDTMNADRYAMLAREAGRQGDQERATALTAKALRFAAVDPGVERRLRKALAKGKNDTVAAVGELTDADLLDKAIAAEDREQVRALADKIGQGAEPDSDAAAMARYAEKRIGLEADPRTIAVLMPTSGKYRGVGKQLRSALEMGWGTGGGGRRLVFLDTGPDEASAQAAMEKAVFELRAVAVVGPVRSELAGPIARIAEATRTPLLGLHQDPTASTDRPWSMEGLSTPAAQVEGLVEHMMSREGMDAFAIFAPDSAYGQAAADAFTAAVEARGGTISVREHYDTEATDLIPFAKKLGRKDYEARAAEWREVRRAIEEAGGDPSRAVLPPIIDFDAIFVPDGWRRIPVAAAGLAYEEFPIGDFAVVKGEPTYPLLGLSGWNNPQLVTSGGPYVRQARFVDVFLPGDPSVAEFTRTYTQERGKAPSTLEAQVFSVGRVLAAAAREDADTREGFRRALLEAETSAATATGARSIDPETRRVDHAVRILTLDKDGIRPVEIASDTPEQDDTPAPE